MELIPPRRDSMEKELPRMLDVWSWICELPDSASLHSPSHVLELASSTPGHDGPSRSIQLQASRNIVGPSSEGAAITFSLHLQGFESQQKLQSGPIWVSDTCPLSSDKPFLPLILQLLRETMSRSPTAQDSACRPRSKHGELRVQPVAWMMDSHAPESLSGFFNLVFLMRLFWLCCFDAPGEVGSFYFHSLLAPSIEAVEWNRAAVLPKFLASVGVDAESCFTRALGYMLAKWLILMEVGGAGLKALAVPTQCDGRLVLSYATEAHGLWILKGYAPIQAMKVVHSNNLLRNFPVTDAKDSVLKYVLAHQQLEAVIQMEYSVKFCEGYIQVNARVDNIRLHVVKLAFKKKDNDEGHFTEERHFPSRARLWVGPEVGATYVGGFSLGQSTNNAGREFETQKIMKGSFGKTKVPKVKAKAWTTSRTRIRSWRWDQDAEGNAVVFDGVLCDSSSGQEVATGRPKAGAGAGAGSSGGSEFQKRYTGANRPFTKAGGVIFAGDECGRDVVWRLSREMEGSVLKWRLGGQIWLTYWPSNADVIRTSHFETRVVEFCDEVDLPLIPGKVV